MVLSVISALKPVVFPVILDLVPMVFLVIPHLVVATGRAAMCFPYGLLFGVKF